MGIRAQKESREHVICRSASVSRTNPSAHNSRKERAAPFPEPRQRRRDGYSNENKRRQEKKWLRWVRDYVESNRVDALPLPCLLNAGLRHWVNDNLSFMPIPITRTPFTTFSQWDDKGKVKRGTHILNGEPGAYQYKFDLLVQHREAESKI